MQRYTHIVYIYIYIDISDTLYLAMCEDHDIFARRRLELLPCQSWCSTAWISRPRHGDDCDNNGVNGVNKNIYQKYMQVNLMIKKPDICIISNVHHVFP